MSDKEHISDSEAEKIMHDREHPDALKEQDEIEAKKETKPAKSRAKKSLKEQTEDNVSSRVDTSQGGLGVVKTSKSSEIHSAADALWKNVPLETLPTGGMFYQDGMEITIKPAQVFEIRHWSTIDETDWLNMDDKMNFIVEKCLRVKDKSGAFMDWRDVKEIDRFFLIFRIHELTFPKGENKIMLTFICDKADCGEPLNPTKEKKQLMSHMLNLLDIPKDMMKYYSPSDKAFIFDSPKLGGNLKLTLPSIGVASKLKRYANCKREEQEMLDPAFIRIAPYLIDEWRGVTDDSINYLQQQSFSWGETETLFLSAFADKLEQSVKLTAKAPCKKCGEDLEVPLFFRGEFSIKSLFTVSIESLGLL